jgi:hypothetical protein
MQGVMGNGQEHQDYLLPITLANAGVEESSHPTGALVRKGMGWHEPIFCEASLSRIICMVHISGCSINLEVSQ